VKLTPLDIRKQEFKRTMRGLDPDEVEAFLSMVADELELLIREKNSLNDELIKLRTQLKDYQQVEHTLRDTLVRAQNTVEESRANSLREAEIIMHEAELQAEQIIKEAKDEVVRLRNEIDILKAQKDSFAKRLRHLLESQVEVLEVLSMDDVNFPSLRDDTGQAPKQRGRMPRPLHAEAEPRHPEPELEPAPPSAQPFDEPRIIRGEKKFDQPTWANPSHDFRPQPEKQPPRTEKQDADQDELGNRISDQFII